MRWFVRRWPWLLVLLALAGWYPALRYLASFRAPDVIFVTTPNDIVELMLDMAQVGPNDVVYDLGSGDGRIPIAAARRGATAVGIEIDVPLAEESRNRVASLGLDKQIRIRRGDIFEADLRPATVITMYLKPFLNTQLRAQLDQCAPGTRIVSHMWSMPGVRPTKVIDRFSQETQMEHRVYLWTIPLHDDPTATPKPVPPATRNR
jgi:SAM-dependent methyltransferase